MVEVLGIALAAAAAIATAVTGLFVRLGTTGSRSNDAVFSVLVINLVILVPLTGLLHYPDFGVTPRSIIAFTLSGVTGTFFGRAFYFAGIKRIGASRAEPMKASTPLFATIAAVLLLGELVTPAHAVGILLIVIGVVVISREGAANPAPIDDVTPLGLSFPLLAALSFGIEPIFVKVGFAEGTPVLVGLVIKIVTASALMFGYLHARGALPSRQELVGPHTRWYIAAGIGNTVFLLAMFASLEVAPVVLSIPIIQTSPLVTVLLSAIFLQRIERVTPRLVAAAAIVVSGAIAVTIFG